MIKCLIIPLITLGLAGCASPQRFQAPPQTQIITPQPQQPPAGQHRDLGGPYTREREDREFGR
jgi:hypothetical protein